MPPAKAPDSITIEAVITPPLIGDLRIIMQQRDSDGSVVRSVSNGKMGQFFSIRASQAGKELPVETRYDAVIWSGLSWGVGEVRHDQIAPGKPIRIRLLAAESDPSFHLDGRVYRVEY
jgi:flavin-dependent dehydrogenase